MFAFFKNGINSPSITRECVSMQIVIALFVQVFYFVIFFSLFLRGVMTNRTPYALPALEVNLIVFRLPIM